MTDELLMEAVVRGDLRALGALFERHKGPLFAFLLRYLHDHSLAEDVVVDTFLRVNDRRQTYKIGMKFSTWLYAIAYHLAADRLRRSARLVCVEEQLAQEAVTSPSDPTGDNCSKSELGEMVRRAIARLPEDQRIAIVLREYEGFSYREIASITNTSEETIRVRTCRARQTLRKLLQPYFVNEDETAVTFAGGEAYNG